MTTEIFTKVTLGITELKVNPMQVAEHDMVCVLSRSKPAFYTVSVERMEELLSAEEQFENGYMVQGGIKVGDTVRIKSLKNTYNHYGTTVNMLNVGDESTIDDIDGYQVLIGIFSYHIDDLELVK